jgi:hypothetical protein
LHQISFFSIITLGFVSIVHAITLSPADSLSLQVAGGATISASHGSGAKASENGLLICVLDHSLSDRFQAICGVRGGESGFRSFIEEAEIRWTSGQNKADAGFLSQRYGFCMLYRPNSIFNFLFDKPLLLDAYGFGIGFSRQVGTRFGVAAGSTIGTRENGQAHVLLSMDCGYLASRLLGEFETYSQENQDNGVSSGLEMYFRWSRGQLHGIAKFTSYIGYGHAANSTMVPGESMTGFLECSISPVSPLTISAMSYVFKSRKRYDHLFYFEAAEASWMFSAMFGAGCGCEWQRDDDVATLMPRVFVKATPAAGRAGFELSIQPAMTGKEISSYRLSGELWMRL